jgi:hypothetical protein
MCSSAYLLVSEGQESESEGKEARNILAVPQRLKLSLSLRLNSSPQFTITAAVIMHNSVLRYKAPLCEGSSGSFLYSSAVLTPKRSFISFSTETRRYCMQVHTCYR